MEPHHSLLITHEIKQFTVKAAITFFLFIITVITLTPDFDALSKSVNKSLKNEKTKVLLGSFIQNPAALYLASEIDEKDEKFDNAIMEIELAIGLLEMHNASEQVVRRYSNRLITLKAQQKKISGTPQ